MYQKLTIIGNLGRDPEMRYTSSGQAVTSFSVATENKYNNSSGEQVKETCWIRVSAWGKLAEVCNTYLKKGSKVFVEGRLTPDKATGGPRIWGAEEGNPKASYEMVAQEVKFLSPKEAAPTAADAGYPDEMPF